MAKDVDVSTSGPVFDGRADRALKDYERQVAQKLAEDAEKSVLQNLNTSIRVNRGVYVSHVRTEVKSELVRMVSDGGRILYGPWLEGTGERNRSTRFKGYFSFRRAFVELEGAAGHKAERILPRYQARME